MWTVTFLSVTSAINTLKLFILKFDLQGCMRPLQSSRSLSKLYSFQKHLIYNQQVV